MIRTALSHKLHDVNVRYAAVGLLLCGALLLFTQQAGYEAASDAFFQRPSSFFTDDAGTRAIYLVLQHLLPAAGQWRRPLVQLGDPMHHEAPTTLLIFAPYQALAVSQVAALDAWMERGGQVILVTHEDWLIRHPEAGPSGGPVASPADTAATNTYLGRHGFHIRERQAQAAESALSLGAHRVEWMSNSDAFQALEQVGNDVLVGSKRIGQGRLVVVPDATAFSNQRLRTATSNAVWLVTLCANWRNGRVLIDEFHQGFGSKRGLMALLGGLLMTPWGWVCAQIVAAGLLYVFVTLRRFGRIHEPLPKPYETPIDLLDARRGLFAAAKARQLAIKLMHQHLQYRLGKCLGYPINLLEPTCRERLLRSGPTIAQYVEPYIARLQDALRRDTLSDHDLLEMGRLATHIDKELTAR